jgi:hypothetical protein
VKRIVGSLLIVASLLTAVQAAPNLDAPQVFAAAMLRFNRGEYQAAYPLFSTLIDAKFADPRAHYYRGLSAWRMGAFESAQDDFRAGAEVEASNPDALGMMSIQMYRIQGPARRALETARNEARLAAYARREKERWEQFSGAADGAAPATPSAPSGDAPATTPAPAADPFAPKTP